MKNFLLWVGIFILVFGLSIFCASFILPIKTSNLWFIKVGSISLFGVLLIFVSQFNLSNKYQELKTIFTARNLSKPVTNIMFQQEQKPNIELEPSISRDYECIHYLAKRCKEMNGTSKDDGVKACAVLNEIFFKEINNHDEANISPSITNSN